MQYEDVAEVSRIFHGKSIPLLVPTEETQRTRPLETSSTAGWAITRGPSGG